MVDLNRVVNHKVNWYERVDLAYIAAHLVYRATHRREVDHARNTGEVLQHHPGRHEGQFEIIAQVATVGRLPLGELLHVVLAGEFTTGAAENVLQQDAHSERQPVNRIQQPVFHQLLQAIVGNG